MAVTGNRSVIIEFAGDIQYSQTFEAIVNGVSPGAIAIQTLSAGNNTINVPSGTTGITIEPDSSNTIGITLKGVAGDTGIPLALGSPTSIGVTAAVTTIVLNAVSTVTVRILFS